MCPPPPAVSAQVAFSEAYAAACPDFQREFGYPTSAPNMANLNLCSKQVEGWGAETVGWDCELGLWAGWLVGEGEA